MSRVGVEQALRQALETGSSSCKAPVLFDDVVLAEYLDGALEASECEEIEAHLALCASCRQLITETRLAMSSDTASSPVPFLPRSQEPARRWRGWRLPLAAAAILLMALALSWQWGSRPDDQSAVPEDQLASLGVSADVVANASSGLRQRVTAALRGKLQAPDLFSVAGSRLESSAERRVLDTELVHPTPVAPRWSAIRQLRPTMTWSMGGALLSGPVRGELLIIDQQEDLVAAHAFEVSAMDRLVSLPWPADAPPLTTGADYAWKVSIEVDGDARSSEFVLFRVLSDEVVNRRLAELDTEDFLAGIELVALGLHDEALERFAAIPETAPSALRRRLVRGVLEHKRFDETMIELEMERWQVPATDGS